MQRGRVFAFIGLLALSVGVHLSLLTYAYDDAYIHLRVARNLIEFGKPYWNIDAPIYSSTSPVWVGILALIGAKPLAVAILNALLTVLAAFIWMRVGEFGAKTKILQGIVVGATLFPSSMGLMETPLALFLLGCAISLLSSKPVVAGILLGVGVFVRPELGIFALAMMVVLLLSECSKSFRFLGGILTGAALPLSWVWYWFQTVIPQTVRAKEIVYAPNNSEKIHVLSRLYFGEYLAVEARFLMIGIVLGMLGITVATIYKWRSKASSSYQLPALTLLFPATILLGGYFYTGVLFPWYFPLFMVPLFVGGLTLLSERVGSRFSNSIAILFAFPIFFQMLGIILGALGYQRLRPEMIAASRIGTYARIGADLSRQYPNVGLVTPEVGMLGLTYVGKVIDACGLVTPEALEFHPLSVPEDRSSGLIGAVPPRFIEHVNPELIVSSDIFMEALMRSPIYANYIDESVPIPTAWKSSAVHVLVRKDIYKGKLNLDAQVL